MSLRTFIKKLWIFGVKQAYAAMFGGFLLLVMLVTHYWYPLQILHRYDFIFLSAIGFQLFMLLFKFESLREARVIIIFHIVATIMELFKTSDSIGSWHYPEEYYFGIANVPLFTGFMYSAVGSYIARVWRLFEFKFSYYPKKWQTVLLVVLIYINFFTHHYIFDIRWVLFAIVIYLFWRTRIYFKIVTSYHSMHILLGWFLVALFIWIAENIATYSHIWLYPNQANGWQFVPFGKMSSWYLLMLLSFVLVAVIQDIVYVKDDVKK